MFQPYYRNLLLSGLLLLGGLAAGSAQAQLQHADMQSAELAGGAQYSAPTFLIDQYFTLSRPDGHSKMTWADDRQPAGFLLKVGSCPDGYSMTQNDGCRKGHTNRPSWCKYGYITQYGLWRCPASPTPESIILDSGSNDSGSSSNDSGSDSNSCPDGYSMTQNDGCRKGHLTQPSWCQNPYRTQYGLIRCSAEPRCEDGYTYTNAHGCRKGHASVPSWCQYPYRTQYDLWRCSATPTEDTDLYASLSQAMKNCLNSPVQQLYFADNKWQCKGLDDNKDTNTASNDNSDNSEGSEGSEGSSVNNNPVEATTVPSGMSQRVVTTVLPAILQNAKSRSLHRNTMSTLIPALIENGVIPQP